MKSLKKVLSGISIASIAFSTVFASAAAQLEDYPSPFIKNNQLDAFIVVGDKAAAEDVVGAVDIGASLQFSLQKKSTIALGTPTATISEGWKLEKGGNKLTLGKNLADVQDTALSQSELPTILNDGKYSESKGSNSNDVTYTQQIRLLSPVFDKNFRFDQPYYPSPGRNASTYVHFASSSSSPIYSYAVTFSDDVKYDPSSSTTVKSDVESTTLNLQGRDYTIIKVGTAGGTNALNSVEMLAGQTLIWLTQNQPVTKIVDGVEHAIEVYDVNDQATSCGVKVDGTMVWMDKGETQTVNGVQLGISDVKTVHAQLQDVDVCQMNIGASKIQILDGQPIKVNGKSLLGSSATFGASSPGSWRGFTINYAPTNIVDLMSGQAWTDPVFNSWKIAYAGNSARTEQIAINTGSITGNIVFNNQDGKVVDLPITTSTNSWSGSASVYPGWYFNQPILWLNGHAANFSVGAGDITQVGILATSSGGQTHLLKIQSVDTYNNRTTINDYTYDRLYENKGDSASSDNRLKVDGTTANMIDLGGFGTLGLTIGQTNGIWNYVKIGGGGSIPLTENGIKTKYMPSSSGYINLGGFNSTTEWNIGTALTTLNNGNSFLQFILNEENSNTAANTNISVGFGLNNLTQQITVYQPSATTAPVGWRRLSPTNSDVLMAYTPYGTKMVWDQRNSQYLTIDYPDDALFANVFMAPITAKVSDVSNDMKIVELNKMNIGAARLASEINNVNEQNLILVGGPCANEATSRVMGSPYDCEKGFKEGEAIIRLYNTGKGNVALVVAGMSALDTRAATRVIANYDAYKNQLKGDEARVKYTSLNNINVEPAHIISGKETP